ncbi:MAG: hypothetical protein H7343_24365, partial [Undibacterium sp.]|nr:hypothetical protein [Opitutaceae bacterium]
MQLSTSTSALDSNLLPLLPATAGCAAPGTAGPGVFADFMPAPAPVFGEGAFVAPVQLPPVSVPGGLVCTLALTVPAPVEAELPATPFSSATAHAPGSGAVNFTPTPVPAADEPVTSDPATNEPRRPIPTPTAARPSRALSSPPPTVRSARALPRAETSPAEKIPAVVPLTLAPLPAALSTDLAITPPSDLTPNSPAPVL